MTNWILRIVAAFAVVGSGLLAPSKLTADPTTPVIRPRAERPSITAGHSVARPQAGNLPSIAPGPQINLPAGGPLIQPRADVPVARPIEATVPQVTTPIAAGEIVVDARYVQTWLDGDARVRLVRGPVTVTQDNQTWSGREVVCWETTTAAGTLFECYFDGRSSAASTDPALFGNDGEELNRLITRQSSRPVRWRGVTDSIDGDASNEQLVRRAAERRALNPSSTGESIAQVQYLLDDPTAEPFPPPLGAPSLNPIIPPPLAPPSMQPGQFSPGGLFPASFADRVTITPRNFEVPFLLESRPVPGTTPPEQVITITRGVNVVIERPLEGDIIDLTADAAVIWTDATSAGGSSFSLGPDTPFQVYLQGNIVLRQGSTVARAAECYFDRREGRGLLRGAEVRTFVPSLRGDLRVRAESLRFNVLSDQIENLGGSDIELFANNAWVTASRFGKPTYRLQAGTLALQQRPAGQTLDPATGQFKMVKQPWLTTTNNQFLLGEIPIVASPYLTAPADDFSVPIKRLTASQDRTFGVQVLSRWDVGDLFGLALPPGSEWTMDVDYLSERGPRIGTDWNYRYDHDLFGYRAQSRGEGFGSFVYDDGQDRLGRGRRNLIVDDESRGALIGRHRTTLPLGTSLTLESGFISDFNFLEQYEEQLWDQGKDAETLIELRQQRDNFSWSILGRPQVNNFVNQTEWLPRLDATLLGQPIIQLDALRSSINWSQHSMVGYGHLNPSTAPVNLTTPNQFGVAFDPLPYVADAEGVVAMTRHELSLPFDVGPVRVVPYALGELAHWGEGLDGNDISRAYGSAGIRGSMMMTKVMPYIRSDVWGLNGLAHKMVFDFDYSISESSQNLSDIPQYNEFDDNAQERFRERLVDLTYGGALPLTADPRGYALRSGAGRSVTAPFHELVDDQNVLRLGWRNRLQTKTGPPQNRRLRDWMTLDLEASFFPGAEDFTAEDNFGEELGLLSAKYAWHVGERTTLLADAVYDIFDLGQETWSVGMLTQRPGRGSLYFGYRQLALGPLDSEILSFNYSYAMGPKWISSYGFAFDLAQGQSQGHSLSLVRVGKDFLFRVTADVDESKDDFGVSFMIEPFIGNQDGREINSLIRSRNPQFR